MSVAVFDASVALKWLIADDALAHPAFAVREAFDPVAPAFIQIEVANALWKYVRAGQVDVEDAIEGVALLARIVSLYSDGDLVSSAQQLAARLTHPVYDCLYLSLAQRLSCPLVTADRRLAERGGSLGIPVTFIGAA